VIAAHEDADETGDDRPGAFRVEVDGGVDARENGGGGS
jgi:hypothetical protein